MNRKTLVNIVIVMVVMTVMVTILKTTTAPITEYIDVAARDLSVIEEFQKFEERMNDNFAEIASKLSPIEKPIEAKEEQPLPTIYVITPTFSRYEQIPELTRLGQTLLNVPKLHWIVADDRNVTNDAVVERLQTLGIPYTYLLTPMPAEYRKPKYKAKPKGVANRNGGIDWLRKHATEGVFYLADDDNTYDIRLFEEIRYTKKVSLLPVGLTTEYGLSTPIVKDGKFVGWYDGWIANRMFPVDMAGFAVSIPFLLTRPDAKMPYSAGYEETGLLRSLDIKPEELELVADNCTKIYVWHTKTQKNYASSSDILKPQYNGTNLRILQNAMLIKKKP